MIRKVWWAYWLKTTKVSVLTGTAFIRVSDNYVSSESYGPARKHKTVQLFSRGDVIFTRTRLARRRRLRQPRNNERFERTVRTDRAKMIDCYWTAQRGKKQSHNTANATRNAQDAMKKNTEHAKIVFTASGSCWCFRTDARYHLSLSGGCFLIILLSLVSGGSSSNFINDDIMEVETQRQSILSTKHGGGEYSVPQNDQQIA